MTFKTKKYQVIKNAISYELANFIYNYFLLKKDAVKYMYENNTHSQSAILGGWADTQIPNTYSCYADFVMETLMMKVLPIMQQETGLELLPTYSYARIYKKGDILARHKDRYSCEISTTLNLGGDDWPIYLDPTGKEGQAGIKVDLKPGDMLIYSGCELEHWREEFKGKDCGQVFLHYNKSSSKKAKENLYDKRPFAGLPNWFKGVKLPKK